MAKSLVLSFLRKMALFLAKQYTSLGGQAVIEGVMMRSPNAFVVAVRTPDGKIRLRRDQWYGLGKKFAFFKKPFFRGVLVLIESMANGIVSLNYSANVIMSEEEKAKGNALVKEKEGVNLSTFFTIATAFLFAMGLFVFLPHALTAYLGGVFGQDWKLDGVPFHAVDGAIKACIFILYIYLIGHLPDIKRVFQYHGAEHKSIATFEAGKPLTVESARTFSTLHPRCGTTFIFFLLFISIILFAIAFALVPVAKIAPIEALVTPGSRLLAFEAFGKSFAGFDATQVLTHFFAVIFKILLVFPVAGISYEILKFSGKNQGSAFCRTVSFPGMMLQKLTTKEPDDAQLEVALASIKSVLHLEEKYNLRDADSKVVTLSETEISGLSDIETPQASLKDFLEN